MRSFKIFIYALLILTLILGCGGNKNDSAEKDTADSAEKAKDTLPKLTMEYNNPNNSDQLTASNPKVKAVNPNASLRNRGPEMVPDELTPGSCEFSAYWFAEYFTSGDSVNAYSLCTDSMEAVVRSILQSPHQIDNMTRNRAAGYKVESISIVETDNPDLCRACITANFMNESRDDCNFYFVNVNGDWLLYAFGEELK